MKNEELIWFKDNEVVPPVYPVIPYIEGDGIGPDITRAMLRVVNASVEKAYNSSKKIEWLKLEAGELAIKNAGEPLPQETISNIRKYKVAIKGPLTTPVGGGYRSLNVALRQTLDLYACVRPVRWYKGIPSPVKHPEKMNMVIYRENTEDVYSGIEWQQGSVEANKIIEFLDAEFGVKVRKDSGIGIKPISRFATKRLVLHAIRYALKKGFNKITLVHKGNIMKFTEGAFRDWGYEAALEAYPDVIIKESDFHGTEIPAGKILINDRIADNIFQQILTRTDEYQILVTPNLNGDYLSDAAAAQVGGLGMSPGANIGDEIALFEATHGTAPKYANLDKVNPGSLILSAVMMLEYINWNEAADLIVRGLEKTIAQKYVTYDLARQMIGATEVKTSEFAERIAQNM